MIQADLVELVGYGMAAFVAGYGVGFVIHAIRRFFEQV